MKAEHTYIPQEEMLAIAREAGCDIEEQKSYYKITRGGGTEQILYVAKTRGVARVDLSGFELKEPEVARYLGGEKFGRVHYMLRFDKPAAHIKSHFRQLCLGLGGFVSLPKSKRGRPVGLKGSHKLEQPVVVIQSELSPQQMMERLVEERDQKRAVARKMGFPLSRKTEEEYSEKIEEMRKRL